MKTLRLAILLIIFLLIPAHSFASDLGDLRVSLIDGDVQVRPADTDDWVPASINLPLREGDSIWVPAESRVELQLMDGTFVRLDENSSLDILRLERYSSQFYLAEGRTYINSRGSRDSLVQLDSPGSSARVYGRGVFRVDVTRGGDTGISALQGSVIAENSMGRTTIEEGRTLSLRGDNYAELLPLGRADAWERWNRERDEKVAARRYSERYLPNTLDPYSYELDAYGKWIYERDYGYVWTPTVSVSVGWSPYHNGRWVWIGSDYVWISYDPWGWVPFHYGRWSFIASIGWCWVPPARNAVYWGPGYVGWVHTPSYVAWVPLAPGEIYYGYGYYGPHSVNVTNVNISTTHINVSYRNLHASNAITAVTRDTFVGRRPVEVRLRGNPFVERGSTVGRPLIRQEQRAYIPVSKEISRTKLPPAPVRELRVKQLRQERPLVKDRGASVMNPRTPQEKMPVRNLGERPVQTGPAGKAQTPSRSRVREPEKVVPRGEVMTPGGRSQGAPATRQQEIKRQQPVQQREVKQPLERNRQIERPTPAPRQNEQQIRRQETLPQRGVQQPPERSRSIEQRAPTPRQQEVRPPSTIRMPERQQPAPAVRPAPQMKQERVVPGQQPPGQERREMRSAPSEIKGTPPAPEKKGKGEEQNVPASPENGERPAERRGGIR